MTRAEYIATYAPAAVTACTEMPELFPSVLLAQAVLESGNGNSQLARSANNHFGIKKGAGWTGDIAEFNTREFQGGQWVSVKAPFRKYATVTDSFRDRNQFLARNPRYRKAGVFTAPDPESQARALQRAGYATDPEYADKLITLISRNGLKAFDRHIAELAPAPAPILPVKPAPAPPAPAPPKIPIPAPPPVKRSWVDRLIAWIIARKG